MYEFDTRISSAVSTTNGHEPAAVGPLSPTLLDQMQRYWAAANYLTVAQIYLRDNVLLREPLEPEHVKPRLLGHWGTSPGLSLIYIELNRLIKERDTNVIRSEEHTSELQSRFDLVCRLLLEKKKKNNMMQSQNLI